MPNSAYNRVKHTAVLTVAEEQGDQRPSLAIRTLHWHTNVCDGHTNVCALVKFQPDCSSAQCSSATVSTVVHTCTCR